MSRQNKVNPGKYTQAGRLSQDDAARAMVRQRASIASQHPRRDEALPWEVSAPAAPRIDDADREQSRKRPAKRKAAAKAAKPKPRRASGRKAPAKKAAPKAAAPKRGAARKAVASRRPAARKTAAKAKSRRTGRGARSR